jgi:hypothetical protein
MAIIFLWVVVAGVCLAVGYFAQLQKKKRVAALANIAAGVGFVFTRGDADHLVDMPFRLFNRGSRRTVECEMGGVHNGVNMRIFDYKYYESSGRNGQWYKFTCGLALFPAACPPLQITHQRFLGSLENLFGGHDIQFESDDFNKRFKITCEDQRFAFSLIDGKMMEWLSSAETFNNVEVVGPWVLYTGARLEPNGWLGIGAWLDQFHAHIPNVVYSQYPGAEPAGR